MTRPNPYRPDPKLDLVLERAGKESGRFKLNGATVEKLRTKGFSADGHRVVGAAIESTWDDGLWLARWSEEGTALTHTRFPVPAGSTPAEIVRRRETPGRRPSTSNHLNTRRPNGLRIHGALLKGLGRLMPEPF